MAKLPSVPNLDPGVSSAGTKPPAPVAPSVAGDEGVSIDIDVDIAEGEDEDEDPGVSTAPGTDTIPAAAESTRSPARKNRGEGSSLGESVDEVLSQASEQTLALVRLEETIGALVETIADVREEMHAGFMEVREAVVARKGAAAVGIDPGLAARIEEIDEGNQRGFKKLRSLILVILMLCLLLAAGLAASILSPAAVAKIAKTPPPPPVAAMTELDADSGPPRVSEPEPATSTAKPKAKKRHRRR